MGWVNAVAVLTAAGEPSPVYAAKVTLVRSDDREALAALRIPSINQDEKSIPDLAA
jgi:hypothetical protein